MNYPALNRSRSRSGYTPPPTVDQSSFQELLARAGRGSLEPKQLDFMRPRDGSNDIPLHYFGNLSLLEKPCVSIVGTREVSSAGAARAARLARELVEAGVVVMSGLARGVDTVAHQSAIEAKGSTVAVIGTPLDRAYPPENAGLQEEIYRHHLLISPFATGGHMHASNFPIRNRVMAALSDASVIIEASDTSGTLHQAAECARLKRWLFIAKSVADDPAVTLPRRFLGKPKIRVLSDTQDLLSALRE